MRYLILTDVHANIDALDAIEEDYDRLLVLGDLVDYGPAPELAVQWVMERDATAVSGNHDFAMATGADCRSSPISYALSVATREYFRRRMSRGALAYLRRLPMTQTVENVGTTFHLVHAPPRDPLYQYLAGDAADLEWEHALGEWSGREALLLVGHTHRPFKRKIGSLTIVNPGSLGMPIDGDPRGCYAIWDDGEVRLRRLAYDIERAVERVHLSGLPVDVVEKMSAVLRYAGRRG
jgi:predicted phosphodiesterase